MANRSYLYVTDADPRGTQHGHIHALSEWNWDVPLSHLILASGNPAMCRSQAWEYDGPIAVCGDFAVGRQRLYDFLDLVQQRGILPTGQFEEVIIQTHDALDAHCGEGLFTLLEPGEILELMASEVDSLEGLNRSEVYSAIPDESEFPGLVENLAYLASEGDTDEIWKQLGVQNWTKLSWLGLEQAQ